jgi:hypothetical protein
MTSISIATFHCDDAPYTIILQIFLRKSLTGATYVLHSVAPMYSSLHYTCNTYRLAKDRRVL